MSYGKTRLTDKYTSTFEDRPASAAVRPGHLLVWTNGTSSVAERGTQATRYEVMVARENEDFGEPSATQGQYEVGDSVPFDIYRQGAIASMRVQVNTQVADGAEVMSAPGGYVVTATDGNDVVGRALQAVNANAGSDEEIQVLITR